jgi:hypothetical protein
MKVIICRDGRVIPWHAVLSFYPRPDGFVWANLNPTNAVDVCVGPMLESDTDIIDVIRRHMEEV